MTFLFDDVPIHVCQDHIITGWYLT